MYQHENQMQTSKTVAVAMAIKLMKNNNNKKLT